MPSEEAPDNPGVNDEASLEEVLDQYLEELAAGESPDQQAYLLAYPKLADALRGVFRTLDFVEATSKSLSASRLEKDQLLGEFRIVREVGRGGMGVVYEAIQTSLGRRVALKILPSTAVLSGTAPERFAREAATAGRLHHTNIVPVYAVGEEEGIHYYAMQFIEGSSLSQHLKELREKPVPLDLAYFRRVAQWGRQVAEALAYAYDQGIIHRDVKPSNLLLDAKDNVWITDFGLARADSHASITVSGDMLGTVRYMSPEQARGGRSPIDNRTDIYALGVTLYELLVLTAAFDGDSREGVLNQIAIAEPKPLRQINTAIPKDLETIVTKCMEKEASRRYKSAAEVGEDCRRFLAGESIRARRTPLFVKAGRYINRHRFHTAAVLVALLLVVFSALLVIRIRHVQGQSRVEEAYNAVLFEHDSERAKRLLDEAEQKGIKTADLFLGRALIPLMNRQPQRAIDPLTRALHSDPANVEARLGMAFALYATGDSANGRRYFELVEDRQITTALGWLLRGLALNEVQDRSALDAYDRAMVLRPDFTPAIEARAQCRQYRVLVDGERSELQPMLDDFDAWVRFWPASARSYSARASGYLFAAAYAATQPDLEGYTERWLEACRRDLDHALAMGDQDQAYVLARRGVYRRYLGDFEGSLADFTESIRLDRAAAGDLHPGIVHHRAIALHALGKIRTALEEIEQACETVPDFVPLWLHRAMLLAELGRLDEGRAVCRDILVRRLDDPAIVFMSAATLELLGEPDYGRSAIRSFADDRMRTGSADAIARGVEEAAVSYLLGELEAGAFLEVANDHPGIRCMAALLIALRELGASNRDGGLASLNTCIDTGVLIFVHYRFAQILIARAEADPAWPRWVNNTE